MYETKSGQFSREALHHFIASTIATSQELSDTVFAQIDKNNRNFISFSMFLFSIRCVIKRD